MSQKRVARTQEAIQEVFLRLYVTIRSKESALAPFEPALEATLPDRDRGPEGGLIEREKLLRMHRAVESVPPQQRQCLHRRAEGLRYREIADAVGVNP